jgi:hypothetical protein
VRSGVATRIDARVSAAAAGAASSAAAIAATVGTGSLVRLMGCLLLHEGDLVDARRRVF